MRNGGPWLCEAVDSVLRECVPGDACIVVDDGSDRPASEILHTHPQLHVVRTPPQGIVAALETARGLANTPYLARIDADDHVVAGRRKAQVRWLEAHPSAGGVGGRAQMVGVDGHTVTGGMARYVRWINGLAPSDDLRDKVLIESPVFHPAVMLRASRVDAVGGYRSGDFPEDYDLWLRLIGAGHTLGTLPQEVVKLRDHGRRLTRTDPRYDRRAFLRLKQEWVAMHLLRPGLRVAVWGAGRAGRPWLRLLHESGCALTAVFDLRGGGERRGVPVHPWQAISEMSFDLLLVCVGAASARQEIRAALTERRPDLVEGSHWWAVT